MVKQTKSEIQWSYETRNILEIIPNSKNPRRIQKRQADELEKSLRHYGQYQPLIVNKDGGLLAGHQRLHLLKKLGYRHVIVSIPSRELSQEEADEILLKDNKAIGDWDHDRLANYFDAEFLVERGGFTMEDLHLESMPGNPLSEGGDNEPKKKCTITITFEDEQDLQQAENRISTIVDEFPGAKYKVKVK